MTTLYDIQELITYAEDDYTVQEIIGDTAHAKSSGGGLKEVPRGSHEVGSTKVVYNSYTDLRYSDSYHGRRLNNTVWRGADEDTRVSALFWATDILSRQSWAGEPTSYGQALSWPRRWVPNAHIVNKNGLRGASYGADLSNPDMGGGSSSYLSEVSVPVFLQDACAELALYLILRSNSGKSEAYEHTEQLASLSLGGGAVDIKFKEENELVTNMPKQVYHMISDFLVRTKELDDSITSAFSVRLGRR